MSIHSRLYPIVEQQGGYFSATQARRAGLSKALLSYHARQGRLLRIRRGIYRLAAFPETPYADLIVAWLAAGERAVVSHESALLLYGLTDLLPAEIHLTVPRTASRRQAGVRLHTARLSEDEVTFRHGLPVTTLPRTLVDLIRSGIDAEWIHQAVRQALERGLVSETTLQEEANRHSGRVAAIIHQALQRLHAL
jgi:predicted transcriptional regulator of viral defense system